MPDDGNGKQNLPTPTMTEKDVRTIVSDILDATKGDKNDALERLVRRNERLQIEVDQVKGQVPEGGTILTAEQNKLFESYKALGKPADITAAVSERDELKGKAALRDRESQLRDAASAHDMNPNLFVRLALQDNLVVDEIRKEGEGEEAVTVAFVRVNEDGSKPVRLDNYAKEEWAEFMNGLSSSDSESGAKGGAPRFAPAHEKGSPPKSGPADLDTIRDKKVASGTYRSF
jgi:hypothetical protein